MGKVQLEHNSPFYNPRQPGPARLSCSSRFLPTSVFLLQFVDRESDRTWGWPPNYAARVTLIYFLIFNDYIIKI